MNSSQRLVINTFVGMVTGAGIYKMGGYLFLFQLMIPMIIFLIVVVLSLDAKRINKELERQLL